MKSGWSNSNKSRKKALATRQWCGRWTFLPKKISQFSEGDVTCNSRRSYDGLSELFSRYTRLWVRVPLTCDRAIWSCRHESTKTIQKLKFVTTEVLLFFHPHTFLQSIRLLFSIFSCTLLNQQRFQHYLLRALCCKPLPRTFKVRFTWTSWKKLGHGDWFSMFFNKEVIEPRSILIEQKCFETVALLGNPNLKTFDLTEMCGSTGSTWSHLLFFGISLPKHAHFLIGWCGSFVLLAFQLSCAIQIQE